MLRTWALCFQKSCIFVSLILNFTHTRLEKICLQQSDWFSYFINPLRYYATFKVRKFESLLYKINTCLHKTATCIGLRAELIFAALYFYIYELKKCVSDFYNLFHTWDINIFLLRGVFFSRYIQLKITFSDEKNISGKIWDTL